ncbi:MAG: hypothetical protein ACK559_05740, partial [bacterium]
MEEVVELGGDDRRDVGVSRGVQGFLDLGHVLVNEHLGVNLAVGDEYRLLHLREWAARIVAEEPAHPLAGEAGV